MHEKILVRATNWVGDLVMSTPAIASIGKSFPGAKISVLVRPPLNELLEDNPAVHEIILYDKKGIHSGPSGFAGLVREIRKRKFTKAILLQNAFEAALIAFLAKIPRRMGYRTDGRGFLLTNGVNVAAETKKKHQVHYYLDLLHALGIETGKAAPRLYLKEKDEKYAAGILKENGIGRGDIVVGINPGAQYGIAKKWYPERFGHVADALVKEYGAKVVIFGGPGDVQAAGAVQASMKNTPVNLAGRTSLRGLAALIKRCSLFITNDSGPMHVSYALRVPTVAIFGSTDPVATGPLGPRSMVVRDPVQCSPCLERTCRLKHYQCMERVTAARVLKAAREMLGAGE